jgi:hypothetical protein
MNKKALLKIISCLVIICFFSSFVFSQTDEYFKKMDGIFDISSKKVTTGLLINRAPGLIDIDMKIYSFPLYFLQKFIFLCGIENFMLPLQKNIEKENYFTQKI